MLQRLFKKTLKFHSGLLLCTYYMSKIMKKSQEKLFFLLEKENKTTLAVHKNEN